MLPVNVFVSPYKNKKAARRLGMKVSREQMEEEDLQHLAVGSLNELPREKLQEALFSNVETNGGSRFKYRISISHASNIQLAKGVVPITKDNSPGFVRYYSPPGGSVRMMVWVDHHIYDNTKEDDDFVEIFILRGDVDPCTGEIKRYDMVSSSFRGMTSPSKRTLHMCEQDQVPAHGLTLEIFA
jgi:hypothetical protein